MATDPSSTSSGYSWGDFSSSVSSGYQSAKTFAASDTAQVGGSVISAIAGYRQARQTVKYQRRMQDYNNKMVSLSDALNQNAITNNVSTQMQKFAMAAVELKANAIQTSAQAEVAAAAAGVEGNSVEATIMDIQANAAGREYNRQNELKAMFNSATSQRQNSVWQARLQKDVSYIPSPSLMSYVLKAGDEAMKKVAAAGGAGG